MEKVIVQIKSFLDNMAWKYTYDEEERIFKFGIRMQNALGDLKIIIVLRKKNYSTYIALNNKADAESFSRVSEFINRINYGLLNGNFEMDYSDGEIRYKSFVDISGSSVSDEVVANSIIVPVFMVKRYGEELLRVILGELTPEAGAKNAESKSIEE